MRCFGCGVNRRRGSRRVDAAMRGRKTSVVGFGALLLASVAALGAERGPTDGLFVPVAVIADQTTVLPDAGPVDPGAKRPEPGVLEVLRSRQVVVGIARLAAAREELGAGQAARLRLNLFEDVELDAVLERTARTRYGYSLSGRVEGDPHGSVTLVIHGDILAGAVHSREGTYVIASRNGKIHTVQEVSGDFECGVDGHSLRQPHSWKSSGRTGDRDIGGDDGSEVDVLVVFTQAALDFEGGLSRLRASVDLAVAWTNDAYAASGVNLRLNLVAAAQVDYLESKFHGGRGLFNQGVDLDRLIDPSDGFMDDVHALREGYAADIVHLIVDQPGGGGIGSILRPTAEDPARWAASVSIGITFDPSLFAHEIGHVMGLLHDRWAQRFESRPLPAYARGYVNQRAFDEGASEESRWHTIMAYESQCDDEGFRCRRLQRFSNPNQRYPDDSGDPLGVPGEHYTEAIDGPADAVRAVNEHRELIASFRQSDTRCGYTLSEHRREVPAAGGAFSVDVNAPIPCSWTVAAFGDFLTVESSRAAMGAGRARYRVEPNDGAARLGFVVIAGETLSVYQSGAVAPSSVCDRTPQVRDAIASAIGRDCGEVSEFDLLDVVTLDLSSRGITTVRPGDFTGLPNLTELYLHRNPIGAIPQQAFKDLVKLKKLDLSGAELTAVPTAIRSLPSLQELRLLSIDQLARVESDAFRGLSELRTLDISQNAITTLEDGVFADLKSLNYLFLFGNRITDVTKEVLQGPELLYQVDLGRNPLGDIREDVFSNIPNVLQVVLRETQLSALPRRVFAGLTELGWLDLAGNRIEDLSNVAFPGNAIGSLNLSNNELQALPAGMFEDFTSPICGARNLDLDLSGNPGAPFPLTLELDRVDGGNATSGPASVVVRLREGASWPMPVRVVATGDASFTWEVTIVNGDTQSEPFEVPGNAVTELRFDAAPRVPGSYKGVRIALGGALRLFALDDVELEAGTRTHTLDLAAAFSRPGVTWEFNAVSSEPGVATVTVVNGVLAVLPTGAGTATVTVKATSRDGERLTRSFTVTVRPPAEAERGTWHGWRLELLRQLQKARTAGES